MIRSIQPSDAAAVAAIYNYYVEHTIVTFEEEIVSHDHFFQRIKTAIDNDQPWLVLEDENGIVGYAYSSPWKSRSAYRHTHEVTIYLDHGQIGKGFGYTLLQALLDRLKSMPIKNIIAVIALPNAGSVALHEKLGMKKVANFKEVGYKFSTWVDVGYWQLSLPFEHDNCHIIAN